MTVGLAAEFATMLAVSAVPHQPGPKPITPLTRREIELIALVADGRTDREIADELHISQRTVSSHLDRIRDKTGCRRRADLTRLALLSGLV
jgi:DNA-binding CsgD family transcriptional regulator